MEAESQSPTTRDLAETQDIVPEIFDSRETETRGIGFPSCSQELMRLPPNYNDPAGYYHQIGVPPWATEEEIRKAVRKLYFALHPDTAERPDTKRLERVKLIAEVLLDPISRERYNRTPPGMRLMDKVYASELSKLDELYTLDETELREVLQPTKAHANPFRHTPGARYDYFAINHTNGDWMLANQWYHYLVSTAPRVGYRRKIKVLLWDNDFASFKEGADILMIPRRWDPSSSLAYGIFTQVVGSSLLDNSDTSTPFLSFDGVMLDT